MSKRTELEPLDITCTDTDCNRNLHCFRATRQMLLRNEAGRCRACGAELVDWSRFRKLRLDDIEYTVSALKYEMIRHHFWEIDLDQRAVNYARRKGKVKLRAAVEHRIRKYVVAPNPRDGLQTPKSGNPVCYAQHATATCCRKCIEEWYGISTVAPISDAQIGYMTDLCMVYLEQKLPDLGELGEKVPCLRSRR